MTDTLLGPWIRRFLIEYLVTECNLSRNTQRSYRDTLCLLIPFVAQHVRKEVDQILVIDVSSDVVRLFLQHLEEGRKCGVSTRNQRLAAIHSLARLHRPAQSRAHCVVRPTPHHSTQARASIDHHIS